MRRGRGYLFWVRRVRELSGWESLRPRCERTVWKRKRTGHKLLCLVHRLTYRYSVVFRVSLGRGTRVLNPDNHGRRWATSLLYRWLTKSEGPNGPQYRYRGLCTLVLCLHCAQVAVWLKREVPVSICELTWLLLLGSGCREMRGPLVDVARAEIVLVSHHGPGGDDAARLRRSS